MVARVVQTMGGNGMSRWHHVELDCDAGRVLAVVNDDGTELYPDGAAKWVSWKPSSEAWLAIAEAVAEHKRAEAPSMRIQQAVKLLAAAERAGNGNAARLLRELGAANERPSSADYEEVALDCIEYATVLESDN